MERSVSLDMLKERWCARTSRNFECTQLGCVSQDSYPRKSVQREVGKLGSKHAVKFSTGTWHQIKILERKGSHREELSRSVHLMSVVLARQNSRKNDMRRPCTKKDAPAEQHRIWRKYLQDQEFEKKQRFILILRQGLLRQDQRTANSKSIREHQCTWWAKKNQAQK